MQRTPLLALIALGLLSYGEVARGVEYKFSGTVSVVSSALATEFSLGETLTGRVFIDPSPLDSVDGLSFYTVTNFTAQIGPDYVVQSVGALLSISDNYPGVDDQVALDVTLPLGLTGGTVAGHVPEYFTLNLLYNPSQHASTALKPQFLDGAVLDRSKLRFDGNESFNIRFKLSDFSAVPEPTTIVLAALGVLSFVATHRRHAVRR